MKTLIVNIILLLSISMLSAQEVTMLDATRLTYAPSSVSISENGDSFTYVIDENYNGQFAENPIAFMNSHFDIDKFIASSKNENYDSYFVTFKSKNGLLKADFDEHGKLLKTYQKFQDVILPIDLRRDMHSEYEGWTLVKTKYTAKTKGELIVDATYKVKLENGNKRQNLKFDAKR